MNTTDETRGAAIRRRLDALGISDREADARGVANRKTLKRIEGNDPTVTERMWRHVEAWLAAEEQRRRNALDDTAPNPNPGMHIVTIKATGNFGVSFAVSGPVDDLPALEASVERLIRSVGDDSPNVTREIGE